MYVPREYIESLPELVNLRSRSSKVYLDDGRLLYMIHCKDIHYQPYGRDEWVDRDLDIKKDINNGLYIAAANKYSIDFYNNLQAQNYMRIRRSGNNNIQLGLTYEHIGINGISIPLPINYKDVFYKNSYIDHVINDKVSVHTELSNSKIISSLKVDYRVTDFEIIIKLNIKGLTLSNHYFNIGDVKYYIPDDNGRFYFNSEEEFDALWINRPKMWNNQSSSVDIDHSLYEINGEFYYRKIPSSEGTKWLSYSKPSIYIDANTYYATTTDGYVSYSNATWATARSATTGSAVNSTAVSATNGISADYTSKTYYIYRSFFIFDTSSIGTFSWVQMVQLGLYGLSSGYTSNSASCMKGTQSTTLSTSDFAALSGSEYAYVSSWSTSGYNVFTFNTQGVSDLNRTGNTKICVRERAHDYNNSTPTTTDGINGLYYADNTGTTSDPYLLVYVVPAPTIINGSAF